MYEHSDATDKFVCLRRPNWEVEAVLYHAWPLRYPPMHAPARTTSAHIGGCFNINISQHDTA